MTIAIERTALIVIDVQNDFCPGGSLAVPDGDAVVPVINSLSSRFPLCVATQDWHPAGHVSFASSYPGVQAFDTVASQGRSLIAWPDHCVQASPGADFHPQLNTAPFRLIVRKGFRPDVDSYSAFFENDGRTSTGLNGVLTSLGMRAVVLCGLALDVCVYYSALDARRLGYTTMVLLNASRAVDKPAGSAEKAMEQMRARGVILLDEWEMHS
ncbi:MAG TPA: bifunctional nicotinamidase/pyrazinamidase [Spirochaetales bacterium]|nr:bifunctional nicotinamidase/pyrazinamidase [Spirochaetales bacterium]